MAKPFAGGGLLPERRAADWKRLGEALAPVPPLELRKRGPEDVSLTYDMEGIIVASQGQTEGFSGCGDPDEIKLWMPLKTDTEVHRVPELAAAMEVRRWRDGVGVLRPPQTRAQAQAVAVQRGRGGLGGGGGGGTAPVKMRRAGAAAAVAPGANPFDLLGDDDPGETTAPSAADDADDGYSFPNGPIGRPARFPAAAAAAVADGPSARSVVTEAVMVVLDVSASMMSTAFRERTSAEGSADGSVGSAALSTSKSVFIGGLHGVLKLARAEAGANGPLPPKIPPLPPHNYLYSMERFTSASVVLLGRCFLVCCSPGKSGPAWTNPAPIAFDCERFNRREGRRSALAEDGGVLKRIRGSSLQVSSPARGTTPGRWGRASATYWRCAWRSCVSTSRASARAPSARTATRSPAT